MHEPDDVIEPRNTNARYGAKRPSDPLEACHHVSDHCAIVGVWRTIQYKTKAYMKCRKRLVDLYITMAPMAIPIHESIEEKDTVQPKKDSLGLPDSARERLEKAGIDLSNGYPYRPAKPLYLDDVYKIRDYDREYVDAGSRADPEKKALFSAAKEIIHLTAHIGKLRRSQPHAKALTLQAPRLSGCSLRT
jgi:hypothetical protein